MSFPTNTRKRNTPRSQPRMAGNSGKIRCADVQPDLYGGPYSLMVNGQEWARFENAEPVATGDTKVDGLQFAHHECGKLFNECHLHLRVGSPR